jgi:hypothetical protein
MFSNLRPALVLAIGSLLSTAAFAAATITIVNNDPAGVGFNDVTIVSPVGGNAGTTLGQQRLNAFQAAANKWGATLSSAVTIRIKSQWTALTCTATSAVLGSAGAIQAFNGFTGAPVAGRWYGKALANKLFGSDLDSTTADINANFNVNLGQAGCLTGTFFYLGLDSNHGANIDLVTVLTHEFAHGLGFQTFTSASSGTQLAGVPSAWDDFLLDTSTNKTWSTMVDAERVASAINTGKLVWTGTNAVAAVSSVLQTGSPLLTVTAPSAVAGNYAIGAAAFGPVLNSPGVTGEVAQVVDTAPAGTGLACSPLSALNAASVNGKIALVDRGTCTFKTKTVNAQNAGAIGVLVADNAAGSPPGGLGDDATITTVVTIPTVRITLADANTFKTALLTRSRMHSGMTVNMGVNLAVRAGADASGRPLLYTPNPVQSGSSVSHWDISATPNQLMEPAINADLTHEVTPPNDLTFPLLKDIGWN